MINKIVESRQNHITDYRFYAIVLIFLLILTFITITVAKINLSALSVVIVLVIATIKAVIILTYFMHLRYEIRLFRILVTGVLLLYTIIIIITFLDYIFR